ncbi:MAG: endonuclease/exonuclease/phosphatase family protein [Prevotella sp.]|nr:endonuclease/exonuclease/phosphatase family protein [Prevotella sp.]
MLKKLKSTLLGVLMGAQIACALLMLLVGYSDRLNPVSHPVLSSVGLTFPVIIALNLCFLIFWLLVRSRAAIVSILALIIAYVPIRTYCPINLSGEVPEGSIRVMSYNVNSFKEKDIVKDGKEVLAALEYIRTSGADLVCLQEGSVNAWTTETITEEYPYQDSVQTKRDRGPSILVLLSKFPIVGKEPIPYPSNGNSSCAFRVNINGTETLVINNHFETSGLSATDRDEFHNIVKGKVQRDTMRTESKRILQVLSESASRRAPQAEAVQRYIEEHSDMPIILCGDFNDNPISYTHHMLTKDLTDCFVASGNGPGWSFTHYGMRVRIDNILCSDDWEPYGCLVDNKTDGSDHFPVITWLKMKEKR